MAETSFDSGSDKLAPRSVMHQPTEAENNWHPDMSRERPEWRTAHATQKDAALDVDKDGVYIVKDGDTLSDIARRSLKQQATATDVATVNQEVAKIVEHNVDAYPGLQQNPHLIHAGDQLRLGIHPSDSATLDVPPLSVIAPSDKVVSDTTAPRVAPAPASSDAVLAGPTLAPVEAAPQIVAAPGAPTPFVSVQGDLGPAPAALPGAVEYRTAPGAPPYQQIAGGDYTDQEAARLSQIMANNPHAAANEMRDQIQQIDPQTAGVLIEKTKNNELVGGLGDLQIQVEFDQRGRDSGYRNVSMATPDGIEQIAEIQAQPQPQGYNMNPLGFIAGAIVGDLAWQQRRGMNFNDDHYREWCNREQGRENYWYSNNSQFVQNWQNPNYRSTYQNQNWQSVANNPTASNTYITNNRYDTTIVKQPVKPAMISDTISHTSTITNNLHPRPVSIAPGQLHRVSGLPPVEHSHPEAGVGARPAAEKTQHDAEVARQHDAIVARQRAEVEHAKALDDLNVRRQQAAEKTRHDADVAKQPAAEKTRHDADVARQQAAEKTRHDADVAKQQAAEKTRHDADVAKQQAAEKTRHDADVAKQQAAEKTRHDADVARQQAAEKTRHDADVAKQQAAAKAQHDAEVAKQQAAAKAQHDAEVAKQQAAAKAQHDAEVAKQQAAAVPPKKH